MISIYCITNDINGKVYIGLTHKDPRNRFLSHMNGSGSRLLKKAVKKYGRNNFSYEVIDTASTRDTSYKKEMFWINAYCSFGESGYNMSVGGESGANGAKHSLEVRTARSERLLGVKRPDRSDEWKANISKSKSGQNNPNYGRCGDKHPLFGKPAPFRGMKHTEETKEALRKIDKTCISGENHYLYGKSHKPETIKKLAEAMKGKHVGVSNPSAKGNIGWLTRVANKRNITIDECRRLYESDELNLIS